MPLTNLFRAKTKLKKRRRELVRYLRENPGLRYDEPEKENGRQLTPTPPGPDRDDPKAGFLWRAV